MKVQRRKKEYKSLHFILSSFTIPSFPTIILRKIPYTRYSVTLILYLTFFLVPFFVQQKMPMWHPDFNGASIWIHSSSTITKAILAFLGNILALLLVSYDVFLVNFLFTLYIFIEFFLTFLRSEVIEL